MVIADARGPHSFRMVDRELERVKLGEGVFRNGRLRAANMKAALEALERFADMCKRLRVQRIAAVATSAVREAENGAQFLREVKRRTGLSPELIDGREEAELIFLGVRHSVDLEGRRGLVLDLGGGSLEVMYGEARRLIVGKSLPLGVRRLRDEIGADDPLTRRSRNKLWRLVRTRAEPLLKDIRRRGVDVVVATSGTQLALGRACIRLRGQETWGNLTGCEVGANELNELAGELLTATAVERANVAGVDAKRVDTIHLGAAVLTAVLGIVRAERILLCEAALREGLLLREMARYYRTKQPPHDILRASAFELLDSTGADKERATRMSVLATKLFNCARRVHRLPARVGCLLEVAALLVDVGHGISYIDRKHIAYQLIRGGGLRGATDVEIEAMALAARYSLSGAPKRRHRTYAALEPDVQHTVKVMAGMLRVAAGLDRGRSGVVTDLRCTVLKNTVRVVVRARKNAAFELDGAAHNARLLSQTLGREFQFVAHSTRGS
ncbi:MAG: Ppx/GppA family phosphatase [Planctomycetes bacterium]|nr:Ppx/GppA family phosphatase [Planctomycetota bacterium]MCW8134759.1 Ppx/GppA family phosphatase [Planctomycetota bacterium]